MTFFLGRTATVVKSAAAVLLAASCGGSPSEPGCGCTLALGVDTRSASALGYYADCILVSIPGLPAWSLELGSTEQELLLEVPSAGACTLHLAVMQGDSLLAESTSAGVLEPDTGRCRLRLAFESGSGRFTAPCSWGPPPEVDPPDSILFVGNSYTFANGGMDSVFALLVESAHPGAGLVTAMVAKGGYTLQDHWNDPETMAEIAGGWDLVIFQEQSTRPLTDPGLMWEYAVLLGAAVEEAGGHPGFFMTWAREWAPGTSGDLAEAYFHAGALADGMVAPAGLAWIAVLEQSPGFDLYEDDGSHPTAGGTYLSALVIYSSVWGESPAGISYSTDPTLMPWEMEMLQETAWEIVQESGPRDWRHY
jgi:hypothetical protein